MVSPMEMNFEDLVAWIKRRRKELGLSQAELAQKAGISQSMLSKVESTDNELPYGTLKKLVDALGEKEGQEITANEIKTISHFDSLQLPYAKKVDAVQYADIEVIPSEEAERIKHVRIDNTLADASRIMNENNIDQLPVLDGDRNVGTITHEIINAEISKNPKPDVMDKKVEDVMGAPFPQVNKETSMRSIVELLKEFPAVLIVDRGKPVEIITTYDVRKKMLELMKGK